jgi:DoxX-like family
MQTKLPSIGYPLYFGVLIGVWKVLGGVAIVAPRLARLKEWAYAGIFFDLTGAAVSHAASGDAAANVIVPLVLAGLAMASWSLRPQSRKLPDARVDAARGARLVPASAT